MSGDEQEDSGYWVKREGGNGEHSYGKLIASWGKVLFSCKKINGSLAGRLTLCSRLRCYLNDSSPFEELNAAVIGMQIMSDLCISGFNVKAMICS